MSFKLTDQIPILNNAQALAEMEFIQYAAKQGIRFDVAKHLYAMTETTKRDPVTGFYHSTLILEAASRSRDLKEGKNSLLKLEIDLKSLRDLNANFGHSKANLIYRKIARIIDKHISTIANLDMAKLREGGKLLFLLRIPSDHLENLRTAIFKKIKDITIEVKLYLSNFRINNDSKKIVLSYDLEEINSISSLGDLNPAPPHQSQLVTNSDDVPLWSASERRKNVFFLYAKQNKIDLDLTHDLFRYAYINCSDKDSLTGFDKAVDRNTTIHYLAKTIQAFISAFYIEIDVRNLGGINAFLGRKKGDEVYQNISKIVHKTLKLLNDIEVVGFRHGGDEFSFVIVSTQTLETRNTLFDRIVKSLYDAQNEMAENKEFQDLRTIKHHKYPHDTTKQGVGIAFGVSHIHPNDTVAKVLKCADAQVEIAKTGSYQGITFVKLDLIEIKSFSLPPVEPIYLLQSQ